MLTGGQGLDSFRLDAPLVGGFDTIVDFNALEDSIQLENAVFSRLTAAGNLKIANFISGAAAADSDDYIRYNPTTGALFYDADGNGVGSAVQIAALGVNLTISHEDFIVI